jgi:hypothetical protein
MLFHDDDRELLEVARSILFRSAQTSPISENNRWRSIRAGAFVTAYHRLPPNSSNVYCCMSNGEYDGKQTVVQNVMESAERCRDLDARRGSASIPPLTTYWEVSILRPRSEWTRVNSLDELKRSSHDSIYVNLGAGSAVYLPSVWNERPSWSSSELVLSLAAKASGYDREFNSLPELTREFTEWYAARIPTLELHPPSKNAGLSLEDGILGGAWSFYMAFADRLNGRLAYIVCSDGTVTYGNDGAWVRSYGDVTAAFLLAKKMNAMTFIQPFVAYLRARKETDPRSFAARLSFLRTTSPSSSALECRMLAARIIEEKQFVDPSDMSFGSPEAMLALLSFAPNSQKVREARSLFVQKYVEEGWAAKAIAENGAFAAHWIMRALTNDKVERLCVPVCVDAIQKGASITIEACALSGLVVAKGRGWVESQPWYGPLINRWRSDQHKWFSEARGGFRYYRDQAWYRSDVTSHVVESLLIQM